METLLKQIRKRTKFTTPQAHDVFGIDQAVYSRIENGQLTASPEVAESIAKYFQVPVSTIFSSARYVAVPVTPGREPKEQSASPEAA